MCAALRRDKLASWTSPHLQEARREPFRRRSSTAARHLLASHRRRAAKRGGARASRVRPRRTACRRRQPDSAQHRDVSHGSPLRRSCPARPAGARGVVSTRAFARARARAPPSSSDSWASSARPRRCTTAGKPDRRATITRVCSRSRPRSCCSVSVWRRCGARGAVTTRSGGATAGDCCSRWGRRSLCSSSPQPIALSYIVTHAGKAHVPAAHLGAPHRGRRVHDERRVAAEGLVRPVAQRRCGHRIRRPRGIRSCARGCSCATATACCCSTAAARARARATRTSSAGRAIATSTPPSRSSSTARRRSRAHRRHRAVGRRRDADRGRGRVARAQGDRDGGCDLPLGP